jgi:hypothetical protein
MQIVTVQNAILLIGVLLLASPFVMKTLSLWLSSILWKRNLQQSREIGTVVQLLELKNSLEREGAQVAAGVCRDLVYSVIYNEAPPSRKGQQKPEGESK